MNMKTILSIVIKSIGLVLALGMSGYLIDSSRALALAELTSSSQSSASVLIERCCKIGRDRALENQSFNCKMSAREALASSGRSVAQLSAESVLIRDQNLADQCEMVLESCCLALHRTRNCDSGKQFARSGSACMDVELSKEATIATESFNDCCMSCSLGILAARNPAAANNDTNSNSASVHSQRSLNERCKLISPLANSLSGQLYEQTYTECCQENLPRLSSALIALDGPIDCSQSACSQRCLSRGSLDPLTRRPVEHDRCDCFGGFKLAPDGISCVDVDECKQNLHTCNRQSEVCDNTHGSFRCLARSQHNNQQHLARPSARSLLLDLEQPTALQPEQLAPFASMRLCPVGSRWSANENRCQQVGGVNTERHHSQQQQHWNRHLSSFSSSSSRRVSSAQLET